MSKSVIKEAQNPLILRCHRLLEAFTRTDDEHDFFIDRREGFLVYVDLDKPEEELSLLNNEIEAHHERYVQIPKSSFYETKKLMENFVNEKIYDIDSKEKMLEIIQSKESRQHFLEFLHDHHAEQEKWTQYYQERTRVRIIEWLRHHHFHFVFEEDIDLPRSLVEQLKQSLFDPKANKDVLNARKILVTKAKTYYSNDALHPKPKRGRPPKQVAKPDIEPQLTPDLYMTLPPAFRPFLFVPEPNPHISLLLFMDANKEDEGLRKSILGEDLTSWGKQLHAARGFSGKAPSDRLYQEAFSPLNFEEEDDEEEDEDQEVVVTKKKKAEKTPAQPTKKTASNKLKRITPKSRA